MEISQQVIDGIKRRSEQAFKEVYFQYFKLVKHVVYKMVRHHDIADDLVQETFMKMYERIDTYKENTNFKYWLLQIARNLTLDHIRKDAKQLNISINESAIDDVASEESSDYDPLQLKIKAILSDDEYDIVIYRIFHNLKFQEISTLLDTTTSVVTNKYARAIKKLKRELREEDLHE